MTAYLRERLLELEIKRNRIGKEVIEEKIKKAGGSIASKVILLKLLDKLADAEASIEICRGGMRND
jgi:hypothetical protein